MWFDVKAALAEIGPDPVATLATTATQAAIVAEVAIVATPPAPKSESRVAIVADVATPSDPERYLAYLRQKGPSTYGAAATALGWGATRAGQAESRLRDDGAIQIGKDGRAHLSKAWSDSTALVGNARQGVHWSECQK